jgi:hypothetical protein
MGKVLEFLKENLSIILVILLSGYVFVTNNNSPQVVEKIVEKPVIQEVVHREVVNTIQVKEKASKDDADIVVENKEDLKISLNGKLFSLTPQNDKTYDFGKDYVELKQSSIYNINISNEPLEPSWGVGVGVTDNKNLAGIVTMRLRSSPTHVWIMSDGDTTAGGILFSTNYK